MFRRGRTTNTNDVAVSPAAITLNTGSAVTIAAANEERLYFHVALECDSVDECLFIKLQAASVDNSLQGIPLYRTTAGNDNVHILEWTMPSDNIYTGEISAIEAVGTPTIYVTEY